MTGDGGAQEKSRIFGIFNHPIRGKIVGILAEKGPLTYTDLRREMETKLEIVASQAVANVDRSVAEGDTSVSLAVLKGLGLLGGRSSQVGTELADEIRGEQKLRCVLASLSNLGPTSAE